MTAVETVVAEHTAGSPVDENILWTNRSPRQIAEEVALTEDTNDAVRAVRGLVVDLDFALDDDVESDARIVLMEDRVVLFVPPGSHPLGHNIQVGAGKAFE